VTLRQHGDVQHTSIVRLAWDSLKGGEKKYRACVTQGHCADPHTVVKGKYVIKYTAEP